MQKEKYFLGWLTESKGIAVPLVAWGVLIVVIACIDFIIIQTGLGDYAGIDKSSDFALFYNLIFNAIAVSSNLGGPFDPSGWILFTVAIQDPLGLLFYGVTIAKLVNRSQEKLLDDIHHKVHLMINEEDWDVLLDALRERAWKLRNNTSEAESTKAFLLKELASYVHLLLQQRPYTYKDDVINFYEYEVILRYALDGLNAVDPVTCKQATKETINTLCSTLKMYHNGLKLNSSALADDPTISELFQLIENQCQKV